MADLCELEELIQAASLRVAIPEDHFGHGACLVYREGQVHGYLNRCPHTGVAMDWIPGQFLTVDGMHIQCAVHGALFRVHDGLCVAGPCPGARLSPLPLRVEGGVVRLLTAPPVEAANPPAATDDDETA